MNKVVEQKNDDPIELRIAENELDHLMAALEYYRQTVDPSSGDVLIATEYTCPGCGSDETFRAQEGDVSRIADHPDVGIEVFAVDGIAQCTECALQVVVTQFEPVGSNGFDEAAWEDLYEQQYRSREVVERVSTE